MTSEQVARLKKVLLKKESQFRSAAMGEHLFSYGIQLVWASNDLHVKGPDMTDETLDALIAELLILHKVR